MVVINFKGLETLRAFYGEQSVFDFLSDAADFFKDNLRRLDLVCRYGDSGFGIILPSTGQTVSTVRQRLLDKVSRWMIDRYASSSPVRVEIGHGSYPDNGRNSKELFKSLVTKPLDQAA